MKKMSRLETKTMLLGSGMFAFIVEMFYQASGLTGVEKSMVKAIYMAAATFWGLFILRDLFLTPDEESEVSS